MSDHLVAFLFADNAGDRDSHLAPGNGRVNWDGVFSFANQIGFSNPITMETAPWGAGPDYSVECWQQSVNKLDELVERA